MKILTILLRAVIGAAFGSSLGVGIIFFGLAQQGIGIAIIGGLLGIILAVASVLYETTGWEMLSRGFILFLKVTAKKNLPGSENLIPLEEKDIPSIQPQEADQDLLTLRLQLGMRLGGVLGIIPAILIAIYIPHGEDGPDPLLLEILKGAIIVVTGAMFIFAPTGMALAALTIRGLHRRNILLGAIIGTIVGAGLATAVSPGAKAPA